jgi:hypothetical protein
VILFSLLGFFFSSGAGTPVLPRPWYVAGFVLTVELNTFILVVAADDFLDVTFAYRPFSVTSL